MEIHPIAIGAVIAAGITGLISLLGLIISKEQKTSEFRQQWIDSLRDEISELLGHTEVLIQHVRAISDSVSANNNTDISIPDLLEKVKPELLESEKYYHKILLRVNPAKHKELIGALEVMRLAFRSGKIPSSEDMHEMEIELIRISQNILKTEWCRVKRGEPTFRVAKYCAVLMLLISIGLGVYMVLSVPKVDKSSNKALQLGPTSAPLELYSSLRYVSTTQATLRCSG